MEDAKKDNPNNIIYYLLKEFSLENKWSLLSLIIISTFIGILQTNGISEMTSQIIDTIGGESSSKNVWKLFGYLAGFYLLYQGVIHLFYDVKSRLVTQMKPWARYKLLDLVMKVNNDIFSEINFTKLNSPIHRVADLVAAIVSDIVAYMIPNIIYVLVIATYFLFLSPTFAFIFLIGNIFVIAYYVYTFRTILEKNNTYEDQIQKTDGVMIDILSNMDKIVYRGKTKEESKNVEAIANENADAGYDYYKVSNNQSSSMIIILIIVFLISFAYLIHMKTNNNISKVTFVTSITILLMFKEKLSSVVEQMPDFIGFIGRMEIALKYFDHVNIHFEDVLRNDRFKDQELDFEQIEFDNVTYKYGSGKNVFKNRSYSLTLTDHKIIGITGPSGSGKSTFVKLLIKMYPLKEGTITIDGVNIKDVDPNMIRENITFVNQNSKLFDKKVIDNMLYGCNDPEKCDYFLNKIMKYPSIAKLYKNMDIETKESGLLGENLSGGQRQIVNMIGGFVNPSKILVLDEPTNALDPTLKKEVIGLIRDFKKYKQSIIIITHDKDVFPLFDDELKMKAQ